MNKKANLILSAVLVGIAILALVAIGNHTTGNFFKWPFSEQLTASSATSQSQSQYISSQSGVKINYANLPQMLSQNSIVRALPTNSLILLKFYNFNTGQRQWEKSYVITKASVKEGTADKPDLILWIHSKYLGQITTTHFCSVIQQAKANGDLGISLEIPKISFMWKYKSVISYRSCFGF